MRYLRLTDWVWHWGGGGDMMTQIRAEIRLQILPTKASKTSRYLDIFWYSDLRKYQHIVI